MKKIIRFSFLIFLGSFISVGLIYLVISPQHVSASNLQAVVTIDGSSVDTVNQLPLNKPNEHSEQPTGSTIYVDLDATGNNDGGSWEDAYVDLQPALETVQVGDQIWVAAGSYYPSQEYCGIGDDRYKSFQLKNEVGVYGGFDPSYGDVSWDDRDWLENLTILSGDIGVPVYEGDNSYHVFCHPQSLNLDNSAILDGFTIMDGNASGTYPNNYGGGIFNEYSSPTLTNINFSDNLSERGGGIFNETSSPTLTNIIFSDNLSHQGGGMYNSDGSNPILIDVTFSHNNCEGTAWGGGMNNYRSSPTLTNVTFANNSASIGGGMFNEESSPTLTNVIFSANSGSYSGGGMYNGYSSDYILENVTFSGNIAHYGGGITNYLSSPTLTNVTFTNNIASIEYGGGMLNSESSPTLTNVTFSNNKAPNSTGGGMHNHQSSPTLTNVTFSNNVAKDAGGGMYNDSSSPTLINNTFSYNIASVGYGGSISNYSSSPSLINCIVWGDTLAEIFNLSSNTIVIYSDIRGGYIGEGNIDLDPLLDELADNGGFVMTQALTSGSPAIDAGNPDPASCPSTDARGELRPQDGDWDGVALCDIGSYEALGIHQVYLPLTIK